ncbi:MAG: glycine--tRNA ligase subunit beta [Candidatus Aminicenantales bacterium]
MELLLEINTEEMPSTHVKAGLAQLEEKLKIELESARLPFSALRTFGTCRRLIVVGDIAPRQEAKEEVVVGPPRSLAFSPDGSPTEAAKGFARAQGVALEKLEVMSTPRGEYVGIRKTVQGQAAEEILAQLLPSAIASLSFPKMMRWGEGTFRFSRPIKNILCLCAGKPIVFTLAGVASSDLTTGHKLHSPKKLSVKSFSEFRSLLRRNHVIIDSAERKEVIGREIEKKLRRLGASLYPDEELLERLAYDVEKPYVFVGRFPQEYLKLPIEVLSAAMREGQKLFSVVRGGRQLPFFVGVADTPGDPKSLIRKGNERVLLARLEDAKFFWEQDRKTPLMKRVAGLTQVIFQEKLGTYRDKTLRLKSLGEYLCEKIDEPKLKKDVGTAAELCKADLLTEMVKEFPSLQGKVGGLYARAEGYPESVAQAIYDHYKPVSLEESLPSSLAGAILSLADKIDSVVGVIGLGLLPSGSSDPFGIRRNANGICRILIEKKLVLSLTQLLRKAISSYGNLLPRTPAQILEDCLNLFHQRLRFVFESQGYRYDLIHAVLGAGIDNIYFADLRLKALESLRQGPSFVPYVLMAKRVNNIIRATPSAKVIPDLFEVREERELYSTFSIIEKTVRSLLDGGDFIKAQSMILKLQTPLTNFFDRVLVMAEDKKIRRNRLALLQAISALLLQLADYSQVIIEGEK